MVVDDKIAFARRLEKALDHAGVPRGRARKKAVANMFGVSREAVRKWLGGEAFPTTEHIKDICSQLNVNIEWLMLGQGAMTSNAAIDHNGTYDLKLPSSRQKELLALFNGLTESQQNEFLTQLEDTKRLNDSLYEELKRKHDRVENA